MQADLLAGGIDAKRGREEMSGEQVLRALVIKQASGFTYEQLAFHLADSQSYRAFCLIGIAETSPKKSTLQSNIKRVRAETLERVNRVLVQHALEQGFEDGQRLRSDATVIEAAIHEPTDSILLVDCVRVLTRHLREAREYIALPYINHHRRAKRRALAIKHSAKAEQRPPLYRDLVKVTESTTESARLASRDSKTTTRPGPSTSPSSQHYVMRSITMRGSPTRCSIRHAAVCPPARPCPFRRRSPRSSSRTRTSSGRIDATRCTATRSFSLPAPQG